MRPAVEFNTNDGKACRVNKCGPFPYWVARSLVWLARLWITLNVTYLYTELATTPSWPLFLHTTTFSLQSLFSLANEMESSSKESHMILALEAMKNNPYLTIRTAAKLYEIPHTTLQTQYANVQSRHDIPTNSTKLTLIEETILLKTILDLNTRRFQTRLINITTIADRLRIDRHTSHIETR